MYYDKSGKAHFEGKLYSILFKNLSLFFILVSTLNYFTAFLLKGSIFEYQAKIVHFASELAPRIHEASKYHGSKCDLLLSASITSLLWFMLLFIYGISCAFSEPITRHTIYTTKYRKNKIIKSFSISFFSFLVCTWCFFSYPYFSYGFWHLTFEHPILYCAISSFMSIFCCATFVVTIILVKIALIQLRKG